MKHTILAACAAVAVLGFAAPAHAQYTGGGSIQMPTTDTMDPTALYNQAVAYIQKNDFIRAVPLLRDVLRSREQDPATNLMMGVAQIGLNDLGEAHRYLTRAVSSKPDLADAIGRLGWVEARRGNTDAAAKQRSVLMGLKQKCNGACPEAGAIDTGIALIDGASAAPAISAATRFNQGIDFIGAQKWSEAIAAFNDVLAKTPDDYEAAYLKGQAQVAAGDYQGAKGSLEAAIALQPGLVEAKGRLGWVEKKLGNAAASARLRADLVALKERSPASAEAIDASLKLLDAQ